MSPWFMGFIVIWMFFLITIFLIGGYFMFRKFLKRLPKDDGKSIIDWEEYYVEKTYHLWSEEQKKLLNELVEPVPSLFRDVAKQKIAAKIGELALKESAKAMREDLIIRGYIIATPKRDHKFLMKKLNEKEISIQPYKQLLQ
ncbi:DUF2621 family protein [Bacillus taeanensis]|uniref:DUF2621 domain-containing protein n=1 Tax=Bacillus taeanensis TaxID=273032 RepID=A0A366XY62_9BACI|nr:DUF2621 family protein [Bacillus taeanensis]RBW71082.1 DUF2621 domain-containing protein [Bacillus taeanensis]